MSDAVTNSGASWRAVPLELWGHDRLETPTQALLVAYLFANPRSTRCGCYRLNTRYAELDLFGAYTRDTLRAELHRLDELGFVTWDDATGALFVRGWFAVNRLASFKNARALVAFYDGGLMPNDAPARVRLAFLQAADEAVRQQVPATPDRADVLADLADRIKAVQMPHPCPTDAPSEGHARGTDAPSMGHPRGTDGAPMQGQGQGQGQTGTNRGRERERRGRGGEPGPDPVPYPVPTGSGDGEPAAIADRLAALAGARSMPADKRPANRAPATGAPAANPRGLLKAKKPAPAAGFLASLERDRTELGIKYGHVVALARDERIANKRPLRKPGGTPTAEIGSNGAAPYVAAAQVNIGVNRVRWPRFIEAIAGDRVDDAGARIVEAWLACALHVDGWTRDGLPVELRALLPQNEVVAFGQAMTGRDS